MDTSEDRMNADVAVICGALNRLQTEYDVRLVAACCLEKASFLYQKLRMLGLESDQRMIELWAIQLTRALEDGEKPIVQYEGTEISTTKN